MKGVSDHDCDDATAPLCMGVGTRHAASAVGLTDTDDNISLTGNLKRINGNVHGENREKSSESKLSRLHRFTGKTVPIPYRFRPDCFNYQPTTDNKN